MKLPKPRGELINEIASSLAHTLVPVGMVEWRKKEWLEDQDDDTLIRCYIATSEFRLNPENSTDFLEQGISPAERKARMVEFVFRLSESDVRRLANDLLERLWFTGELLDSVEDGEKAGWEFATSLMEGMRQIEQRRREEPKQRGKLGGARAAAHWKLVKAEAIRVAEESGLASGEHSAEYIAGQIRESVRAFARQNGRDFPGDPTRKIAEYLRSAGIKKRRGTP